jgi:CBS domain containing-hemolysin-like protein
MIVAVLLFTIGVMLSAFFSGCETGFYRATRVRLRMDAISGDLIARGLIWLANNPALFVATTLIGNNLANYLTSLAIVVAAARIWPAHPDIVGALAPLLLAPIVFVYGELLPKNLFYQAPNRLLRLGGPIFLGFSFLFFPASFILWLLGRGLRLLMGEAPEQLQLSLARQELHRVFDEGHDAGVLRPAQRRVAQGMLALADDPLTKYCVPMSRLVSVHLHAPKADVLRIARRNHATLLLVTESYGRRVLGYVRLLDLHGSEVQRVESYRVLTRISKFTSPITALTTLQSQREPLARVADAQGHTVGLLLTENLVNQLLGESAEAAV